MSELITARLRLREWRDEDLPPFAAMNADPDVMRYFPETLERAESDAMVMRIRAHFATFGFGPWAVEIPGVTEFAGFVGLMVPAFDAHFTPCIEIGWRLAPGVWGQGYATEAARTVLEDAFEVLAQDEVVSLTVPTNLRSRAVMERIGMTRSPGDDFDHPRLPSGHVLQRHVLYRKRRPDLRA
jgi:ribosomal-protein-alanine N-acetyltransferase